MSPSEKTNCKLFAMEAHWSSIIVEAQWLTEKLIESASLWPSRDLALLPTAEFALDRWFGSVWQKENWENTNNIMITRLWWLSLRYGFYDQEGKLQVVNYSADPKGVKYWPHCICIPCKGVTSFPSHHIVFHDRERFNKIKQIWHIFRDSMQRVTMCQSEDTKESQTE